MEKLEIEDKKDVLIEGLTLNGDMLNTLKSNKIVILGVRYENMQDFKDKKRMVRKLALSVEIDNFRLEYFPNRRSISRLVAKYGINASKWIGKTAELESKTLLVGENERNVLFVKE